MSDLENLKNCRTADDLVSKDIFGGSLKGLTYILYKIPNETKYTIFNIPKKSGGIRQIKAPAPELKLLQRKLTNILKKCEEEIFSKKQHINPRKKLKSLSHGFKEKHSIGTNANCHKNKRYVLNFDLENYFQSFNFGRIRGFFIKNNDFLLNTTIATILAQIACHDNELPQGSPCSPVISNLITHVLDVRLAQLARKYKCTYSRYADDITLSTNQKNFPKELAITVSNESCEWKILSELEEVITASGFMIKHSKTRMQYQESRQTVTGLVVNEGVNIRTEYYRYARAMCHSLFTKGEFFLPESKMKGTINQLEGILSHIHYIKRGEFTNLNTEEAKKNSKKDKSEHKRERLSSSDELYSKFLFYKYFVAAEAPLIMCEGKTDIIYLKCAIKQLSKGKVYNPPGKVNFFRHTIRVNKVMRLHEGSSSLKNFIEFYEKETNFRYKPQQHPVIILIDNDSGAAPIYSYLNQLNSPSKSYRKKDKQQNVTSSVSGDMPFYWVKENLYIVPTPKLGGRDSKIEDFFDAELLQIQLDGKKFNLNNTQSGDNGEHGKHIFATRIVQPNQATINFNKFQLILSNITAAIEDYKIRINNIKTSNLTEVLETNASLISNKVLEKIS